ncbi:hypothetical protein [Paenibacillus sp. KS-LC4]|uniref:hypothetical protein n=1 Tax=Paenibacillus sp. KS-LC4 TaxID=2979727 RepID=UPI0030CDDC33
MALVKWIAGITLKEPEIEDLDKEQFLEILQNHKLTCRLLKKINSCQHRPRWISDEWVKEITFLHEINTKVFNDQISNTIELIQKAAVNDLIVLKGFVSYLLTEDENSIREANDVDILVEDINVLNTFDGYEESSIDHEYGKIVYNDVSFDLHRYFPINSYNVSLRPETNESANLFILNNNIYSVSHLKYQDIYKYSIRSKHGILIPNIHMCILIKCCNLLKDYTTNFLTQDIGCICLNDLLEIVDLCNNDKYSLDELTCLIAEFNAYDSIDFVRSLLVEFWGTSLLGARVYKKYPSRLSWNGVWYAPTSLQNLLIPNIDTIVDDLNIIPVAKESVAIFEENLGEININYSEDILTISFRFEENEFIYQVITLNLGPSGQFCEVVSTKEEGVIKLEDDSGAVEVKHSCDSDCYILDIIITKATQSDFSILCITDRWRDSTVSSWVHPIRIVSTKLL